MSDDIDIGINVSSSGDSARLIEDLAKAVATLRKELETLAKNQTSAATKAAADDEKAARKQAADELKASARQIAVDRKAYLEQQRQYNRDFKALLNEETKAQSDAAKEKARIAREERAAVLAAKKAELDAQRAANRQAQDELKASARQIRANQIAQRDLEKQSTAAAKEQAAAARAAGAASRKAAIDQKAAADASREHALSLKDLVKSAIALASAFAAFQGFRVLISEGLQFNKTIETANLGVASLITAQTIMTDSNNKVIDGVDKLGVAQVLAAEQVNKLRIAGLQTTATTEQLVIAFQQAVGVGLRWGLTLDQIRIVTVQLSQAAGALGVPLNQLNEEIRSLLTGTITPRNTRIATALGITNAQVKQAQQAGELFSFVTKRLEAFSVAGEATAKTFTGVMSNIKEALQNIAGDATKPLFDTLKLAGQDTLKEMFDLKTARVSENFSGILDIANDIFGKMGDLLANALNSGVSSAKSLSQWLKESRVEMGELIAAAGILGEEFSSLAKEVFGIVLNLGAAGVKTGFWANILVGVASLVADVHTLFEGALIILGFIGNVVIKGIVTPFADFLKTTAAIVSFFDKDLAKSIDSAADGMTGFVDELGQNLSAYQQDLFDNGNATDRFNKKLEGAKQAAIDAATAHGLLRDTIRAATGEEDKQLLLLDQMLKAGTISQKAYADKSLQIKLDSTHKQIKAQEEYRKTLAATDNQERERTNAYIDELKKRERALLRSVTLRPAAEAVPLKENARASAQGLNDLIKEQEKEALKDLKILLDNQKIAYRNYWAQVIAIQQDAIDKLIDVQKELLTKTTDKGQQDKILDEIKVLTLKRNQVVEDGNEALRKDQEALGKEILQAHVQLLKDEGRLSDARALEIGDKFRNLVRQLLVEGDLVGAALVNELFNIDNAKTRMDELSKISATTLSALAIKVQGINARASEHAITEAEARAEIVKAYSDAKAELEKLLPDMEKAAKLTKDPNQIQAVENLRLKLEEMGVTIRKNADDYIKFKETLRTSATDALTGLLMGAPAVLLQASGEVDALREHLASAQSELDRLSKGPVSEETTDRMRELRTEIQGVNEELHNAKEAVTSWSDLFLDATRSIVEALRQVATQMLATLIIESSLRFVGLAGGGAVKPKTGTRQSFASGGPISGPGTTTSDSIPVWLSTGEYVINARAVSAVGQQFLDAINSSGSVSVKPRRSSRHFADGGLVLREPNGGAGFEATVGLEDGLVLRHLRSKGGTDAIVNMVASNRKTIRSALGID